MSDVDELLQWARKWPKGNRFEDFAVGQSSASGSLAGLDWTVAVHPYPCTAPLPLKVTCIAAPAKHYANWQELVAESWPVTLRWRLVEGVSTNGAAT